MPESHAFRQFLESLNTSHNLRPHACDFHLGALEVLRGGERRRAEELLLERMRAIPKDLRVFAALGLVGSSASVEPLRRAIERGDVHTRVKAAAALARIDTSYDPSAVFLAALREPAARSQAVEGLGRAPREVALPALLDTLSDPDFGIRVTALGALCEQFALTRHHGFRYGRLKGIGSRLLSRLSSAWRPAADEMRALVAALEAGRSPDELGLGEPVTSTPDELEAVFQSVVDRRSDERWRDRIDLDALARLDDVGRRFAETLFLSALDSGDERAPAGLALLGGDAACAAMREALDSARGPMRVALARALERIGDEDDVTRARTVLQEPPDDAPGQWWEKWPP